MTWIFQGAGLRELRSNFHRGSLAAWQPGSDDLMAGQHSIAPIGVEWSWMRPGESGDSLEMESWASAQLRTGSPNQGENQQHCTGDSCFW